MTRLFLCVPILCLAACGGESRPAVPVAPPIVAETLAGVSRAFADARAQGDAARLVEMTRAMLPTVDDLKKLLRAGPDTDAFLAKYDPESFRAQAEAVSRELLLPKEATQTVVKVHSATTEELLSYTIGSLARAEFPGGMQRFARAIAAPGRVWQVIEYLEPGKEDGTKFTCFTVLDGRILAVIRPWRAIVEAAKPESPSK